MDNEALIEVIKEKLLEVQTLKPSYGDEESDVAWLNGKKDLAEDILELIKDSQKKRKS